MKPLSIIFLFSLCLSLSAQTIPMPSGAYQTAVVQKQATIQMQSAAASVVDTNEYFKLLVIQPYTETPSTLLYCIGTNENDATLTVPILPNVTNSLEWTNNPIFDAPTIYVWTRATNAASQSPRSVVEFHPPLPPTLLTLSWPAQTAPCQLLSASLLQGQWSTYATVTTNSVTLPILSGNQFYRLLQPTNSNPVTITCAASNPKNSTAF